MSTTPISKGTVGKFGNQWLLPAGDLVAIEDLSLTDEAENLEFPGVDGSTAGVTFFNFKKTGDISVIRKSDSTKSWAIGDIITLTHATQPSTSLKMIVTQVGQSVNYKDFEKTSLTVSAWAGIDLP